ncbi:MAG: DUF998 domain-containing protein [Zestosphaera sp.]
MVVSALRVLVLLSVLVPLLLIGLAISLSPWFSLFNNALSDLGHAVRSGVAPLFNLGLVAGGLLAFTVALRSPRVGRAYNATLMYSGFSLILVGVFDEVYGFLHFVVSVMFFVGLAAFLVIAVVRERSPIKIASLTLLVITIVSWYVHYTYRIPKGVAIPELVSITSFAPIYVWKYCRAA